MKDALVGLALLVALLWVEHSKRPHRTKVQAFRDMIGLEDCATSYLDDGLMRPA